jgi:hypothetical protein
MAWEEEEAMQEEYSEEMDALESEEEVVVGQMPTVMVPKHIKKRSLKNKALSVTLDEKALRCLFLLRLLPHGGTTKFPWNSMIIVVIFVLIVSMDVFCIRGTLVRFTECHARDLASAGIS